MLDVQGGIKIFWDSYYSQISCCCCCWHLFTFLTDEQRSNQPRIEVLYQIFVGVIDVREAWRVIMCGPTVLCDVPLVDIFLAWGYSIIHLLHRECVVLVGSTWRSNSREHTGQVSGDFIIFKTGEAQDELSELCMHFHSEPKLFRKDHITPTSILL